MNNEKLNAIQKGIGILREQIEHRIDGEAWEEIERKVVQTMFFGKEWEEHMALHNKYTNLSTTEFAQDKTETLQKGLKVCL